MRNTGKDFEKAISATLIDYQSKGIMRVKKVDPPTRVFWKPVLREGKMTREPQVMMLANPFLDFAGVATELAGRSMFFEAKSSAAGSDKPKLGLSGTGGLTDKQQDAMRHWHAAGAITFVLWEYPEAFYRKVGLLTWPMIVKILAERKHAKPSDCIAVETIKMKDLTERPDFWPNVKQLWFHPFVKGQSMPELVGVEDDCSPD